MTQVHGSAVSDLEVFEQQQRTRNWVYEEWLRIMQDETGRGEEDIVMATKLVLIMQKKRFKDDDE